MDGNPRILITRLSHIGDCILTLPMLAALRSRFPESYIAWAVESPTDQLLSLVPEIDELIAIPKQWLRKWSAWRGLRQELGRRRFDVAIDPQGITKSAALGWISCAKIRVGGQGEWGREMSPWLNNRLVETRKTHLVDRSLEILSALGIEAPEVDFRLPVHQESEREMSTWTSDNCPESGFAVINPGASWVSKRWENDRFADVANHLWRRYQIKSVASWAGDEERAMANEIQLAAPNAVVLAPRTNLRQLAALCAQAVLFVGCDTGPLHIASAVGAPCIGLHGPTRPCDSGAYGPLHLHVQVQYHSGSSRERRSANNDAMRTIQSHDVCDAVDRMMTQRGHSRAA